MQTSRKKRPLDRSEASRDARLVVIATEGSKTEPSYFSAFGNRRLKIIAIPSSDGKCSPQHVFDNLLDFQNDYQLAGDDELWLVLDRDRWPEKSLSEVAQRSQAANFGLAVSNPCFEIWLAYHFDVPLPLPLSGASLISHLKSCGGSFSKSHLDAQRFVPLARSAIFRAKSDDIDLSKRWPEPHGSRVHVLMESILSI